MKDLKWWVVVETVDSKSGLISVNVASKFKNYAKLKRVVWKWYRQHLGRLDIGSSEKLVLWALCERYGKSFSSHDAISYYGLMLGLSRQTVGKNLQKLMDKNIIWCAIDGNNQVMTRKLKAGVQHKHFLLVGLNKMLVESEKPN